MIRIVVLIRTTYCMIFIDTARSGHIKLIDFGFSKDINGSNQTFTLCGTPEYLAPEILNGTGYGLAVDWYL